MTESSSFTSLLALVDSHLSKTSVQESRSEDGNSIRIPPLNEPQSGTLSDTHLGFPPGRIPLPDFGFGESPIQKLLAEQVSNMLKAKELKKQQDEEKQRLEDEMRRLKLEDKSFEDLLMQAVRTPFRPDTPPEETLSNSSSFESLFQPNFKDFDDPSEKVLMKRAYPYTTNMAHILTKKVRRAKASAFGRVLSSRLKPVPMPYLREIVKSDIVRFDFKTKSPCDLIKDSLKKKTCTATYVPDIVNFV